MSQVRDDALHSNYMTRGLPAPNHNLPLEILDDTAPAVVRDKLRYRWPLIMARRVATADEIEDGLDNYVPLFSDPLHGDPTAGQQDYPPTWMDPHILVILASQQPEIAELLEQACAGTGIALTLRDISASKAHEQALADLANNDALTKLPNRFFRPSRFPAGCNRPGTPGCTARSRCTRARSRCACVCGCPQWRRSGRP